MFLVIFVLGLTIPAGLADQVLEPGAGNDTMDYSEVRTIAFYVCRSDPVCSHRFFIGHQVLDYNLFLYLFDRFVAEARAREFLLENFHDDRVKDAWLLSMRLATFCTENEVLDSDGYCVCRNGKTCHETSGDVFSFDIVSLDFLCLVVVAGAVYYLGGHLSRLRIIHRNVVWLRKFYSHNGDGETGQARPPNSSFHRLEPLGAREPKDSSVHTRV